MRGWTDGCLITRDCSYLFLAAYLRLRAIMRCGGVEEEWRRVGGDVHMHQADTSGWVCKPHARTLDWHVPSPALSAICPASHLFTG